MNLQQNSRIIVVMGVSGCGKSTIGIQLANALHISFYDGDDFHPESNVKKMKSGEALTDDDRKGWLQRLNMLAQENLEKGAVIACSALKISYREQLELGIENQVSWVFLSGSYKEILSRLQARKGHFMPATLLQSQFDTLEVPTNAITVSITKNPEAIVATVLQALGN